MTTEINKLSSGITGASFPAVGISQMSAGAVSPTAPAPKHSDGWDGNAFYFSGKKYVVAVSPEISKNGLHELRTYCYTGDNPSLPSDKLATIVTEPLKQTESTRTIGALANRTENNDTKCAFCQKNISWGNKKIRYCSDACRTAAYRQRKDTVSPTLAERTFVTFKVNGKNQQLTETFREGDKSKLATEALGNL